MHGQDLIFIIRRSYPIAKNPNTFAKRQREMEKKRKAEEKRKRRNERKAAAVAAASEPSDHKILSGDAADND